jgi:hypothetical protein
MLTGLSLRPSSSPTRTKQRTSHRRAVSRLQSPLISATRGQLDAKVGAYRTGDPPRVFRPHFRWQAVVDQHFRDLVRILDTIRQAHPTPVAVALTSFRLCRGFALVLVHGRKRGALVNVVVTV